MVLLSAEKANTNTQPPQTDTATAATISATTSAKTSPSSSRSPSPLPSSSLPHLPSLLPPPPTSSSLPSTPLPSLTILSSQCKMTEIRGGQSVGLASLHPSPPSPPKCIRTREVVTKRGTGSGLIVPSHTRRCISARTDPQSGHVYLGHLRFATSSRNLRSECHPHEWGKRTWCKVWSYSPLHPGSSTSTWTSRRTWHGCVLTHNGDFNGLRLYDGLVPQSSLANYLNNVLRTNVEVGSDSAKIAGWFELMATKGSWLKSSRKGWAMGVAKVRT